MEKLLYPVWKDSTIASDEFGRQLTEELAPKLKQLGCNKLRISVIDSAVAPAMTRLTESSGPAMDAMISVWVDSSVYRQPFEQAIDQYVCHERLVIWLLNLSPWLTIMHLAMSVIGWRVCVMWYF